MYDPREHMNDEAPVNLRSFKELMKWRAQHRDKEGCVVVTEEWSEVPRRIYCACCGRQVVSYKVSDDRIVGPRSRAVAMVSGACCHQCAGDLDENGLFPEERDDP